MDEYKKTIFMKKKTKEQKHIRNPIICDSLKNEKIKTDKNPRMEVIVGEGHPRIEGISI